eukprot:gene6607-6835_t
MSPPSTSSRRRAAQAQQQQQPVRSHVIHGVPAQAFEVVTLQLPRLSPLTLTKSAIGEFLQYQLISRPAAQQKIQAAVLSAVYLPSQLPALATGNQHSAPPDSDVVSTSTAHQHQDDDSLQQRLHQLDSWRPMMICMFGNDVYPLRESQLQAAKEAEAQLMTQLRLWDAAAWNAALQQLESRKALQHLFAVRSLMGSQEELAHLPPKVFTDYDYTSNNSMPESKVDRSPMRRLFDLARDLHEKVTEGPSMGQQP